MTSQSVAKIGYAQSRMILLTLDVTVAIDFKTEEIKYCLKMLFWLNPILNKALATHIWVATHGLRNAVVSK